MRFAIALLYLLVSLACIPPIPRPQNHYADVVTLVGNEPNSFGSAFVVHTGNGFSLLATARHLTKDADFVGVVHQGTPLPALVIADDPVSDLAIIGVEKVLPAAYLAPHLPSKGTTVYTLGPAPYYGDPALTKGIVSTGYGTCYSEAEVSPCFLADVPVGNGFSGAPVVDSSGQVVGVLIAYLVTLPHLAVISSTKALRTLLVAAIRRIESKP